MLDDIKLASEKRNEDFFMEEVDKRINSLNLANFQRVTANPRSMGYLRFLLKHYAKSPTPWRDCFTADTLVETNKSEIPISNLKPGMDIWSFNERNNQFEIKKVINAGVSSKSSHIYKVYLKDGKSFKTTQKHKFLTSNNGWVQLKDISMNESFKEARYMKLEHIEELPERKEVWDIEVEHNHNFVVSGIIAHNCYKDNLHRFGPEKTKGVCSVLKDTLRQSTHWRGHPAADVGSPGVAIANADAKAAPPWGGHRHLSETHLDMGLEMAMPEDLALLFEELGSRCDVYRVLIGLDEAPSGEMAL